MATMAAPGAATAAVNYYRAILQHGARGMFRGTGMRVYAPTLLIWGMQDAALSPALPSAISTQSHSHSPRSLPQLFAAVRSGKPVGQL